MNMKNLDLIFLRHGKLDLPYKSHGEMPLSVISDLGTGKLNPPVDEIYTQKLIDNLFSQHSFGEFANIFPSPFNRCQRTAALVKEYLEKKQADKIKIETMAEAREVEFDLEKIIERNGGSDFDIAKINNSVFSAMISGQDCESMSDICNRVEKIFAMLSADKMRKMIISHDFLMRVIELFIRRKGNLQEITYADLLDTTRNNYFCGFATDYGMTDILYLKSEIGG